MFRIVCNLHGNMLRECSQLAKHYKELGVMTVTTNYENESATLGKMYLEKFKYSTLTLFHLLPRNYFPKLHSRPQREYAHDLQHLLVTSPKIC